MSSLCLVVKEGLGLWPVHSLRLQVEAYKYCLSKNVNPNARTPSTAPCCGNTASSPCHCISRRARCRRAKFNLHVFLQVEAYKYRSSDNMLLEKRTYAVNSAVLWGHRVSLCSLLSCQPSCSELQIHDSVCWQVEAYKYRSSENMMLKRTYTVNSAVLWAHRFVPIVKRSPGNFNNRPTVSWGQFHDTQAVVSSPGTESGKFWLEQPPCTASARGAFCLAGSVCKVKPLSGCVA